MKRALAITTAAVAVAMAAIALSRRERRPGRVAGSWEPVDHHPRRP